MTAAEVLVEQLRRTREWTLKLLAGLENDDWAFQPQPGLQHPLWICGHLVCAEDLLLFHRCLDAPRLDWDFHSHFPIGMPVRPVSEHAYPSVADVRHNMDELQTESEAAVSQLTDSFLAEPAYGKDGAAHPHYDTKLGAVSHICRHEAFHAGQLATLRRLLGKPFLR